jgi:lipoprotein
MIRAIIWVLFSLLSLTGCAKNETIFKKDDSVIIAHYKEDTITTVTFTDSFPVGDYSSKTDKEKEVKESYTDVLAKLFSSGAVVDVETEITNNRIKVISTLDFSKITNLSEFGIKSPYPSLAEFSKFLTNSGWKQ